MLLNAEILLQYQRCKRRAFLDTNGDLNQRDAVSDALHRVKMTGKRGQKPLLN
jgi:predicted RecB family nuclease